MAKAKTEKAMATKSSKVLTTVIKGSLWARGGKRPASNRLRNEDGTMCCLGIDAVARGVDLRYLDDNCAYPRDIEVAPEDVQAWSEVAADDLLEAVGLDAAAMSNDHLEDAAAEINDNKDTTDDEKIAKLRKVFAAVDPPRRIVWLPNQ